jgi:hypothetical protein
MSEGNHTAGPWTLTHVAGQNFAVQEFEFRGMFGDYANVRPIFNKDRYALDGRTVFCSPEDAKLIAAAPDMLQGLRDARALLVHAECPVEWLDAIIAKATPEKQASALLGAA